jgi:hypothetical protein
MRRAVRRASYAAAILALIFGTAGAVSAQQIGISKAERAVILSHGPWPVWTESGPE